MAAYVRNHGPVSFCKVRLTKDDRLVSRFRGQVVDARVSLIRGSVRDQVTSIWRCLNEPESFNINNLSGQEGGPCPRPSLKATLHQTHLLLINLSGWEGG